MIKIYTLIFVWGPALVGFSLGWAIHHAHERTEAAIVGLIGALLNFFTYRWGLRRMRTISAELKPFFIAGMVAGAATGVMVFGMLALGIIG